MTSFAARCLCGGAYETRTVDLDRDGVVMRDVTRGACPVCGSQVYAAATLERVESVLFGAEHDPGLLRAGS